MMVHTRTTATPMLVVVAFLPLLLACSSPAAVGGRASGPMADHPAFIERLGDNTYWASVVVRDGSADGSVFLEGYADGTVRLWAADSGELLEVIAPPPQAPDDRRFHYDRYVWTSEDSLYVIRHNSTVEVRRIGASQPVHVLEGEAWCVPAEATDTTDEGDSFCQLRGLEVRGDVIVSIAEFSSRERYLSTIKSWSVERGEVLSEWTQKVTEDDMGLMMNDVKLSPDGQWGVLAMVGYPTEGQLFQTDQLDQGQRISCFGTTIWQGDHVVVCPDYDDYDNDSENLCLVELSTQELKLLPLPERDWGAPACRRLGVSRDASVITTEIEFCEQFRTDEDCTAAQHVYWDSATGEPAKERPDEDFDFVSQYPARTPSPEHLQKTAPPHNTSVKLLAVSANGGVIWSSERPDQSGTPQLWLDRSPPQLMTRKGLNPDAVALSDDGALLVLAEHGRDAVEFYGETNDCDYEKKSGGIEFWDVKGGQMLYKESGQMLDGAFEDPEGNEREYHGYYGPRVLPDGRVAVCRAALDYRDEDYCEKPSPTSAELLLYDPVNKSFSALSEEMDGVCAPGTSTISADGDRVVLGELGEYHGEYSSMRVVSMSTGETIFTYEDSALSLTRAELSADGRFIAIELSEEAIEVFDVDATTRVLHLEEVDEKLDTDFYGFALSSDGALLAVGTARDSVLLVDVQTQQHVELSGHLSKVRSVVFSGDGKRLFSGSDDQSVGVWDVEEARAGRGSN